MVAQSKGGRLRTRSRTLASLTEQERGLLEQMNREPLEFVDHPDFRGDDAEARIMRPRLAGGEIPVQRFIPAVADPIGDPEHLHVRRGVVLKTRQERTLFMQYNYSRRRWVQSMRWRGGRQIGVRRLRQAMHWFRTMLDRRDMLANANMPLVLAMAKRTRLTNLDFPELVSEGNMALLRAIAKFDVSRGFKFSTYACRAILKGFSRASMRLSRLRERFPAEFDPAMEQSDFIQMRRDEVEADCVAQLRSIITANAAELTAVEEVVIRKRFALDHAAAAAPQTLDEVGEMIGVTKERVRQIQNKALAKIKEALERELLVA
ncbi:MAG: RNA polymerase sigma factor RpoD [Phycisphaerae bacterium]|nr:RNA polymerase sigma factor RpoD [Phycisphaerae bacterium]